MNKNSSRILRQCTECKKRSTIVYILLEKKILYKNLHINKVKFGCLCYNKLKVYYV